MNFAVAMLVSASLLLAQNTSQQTHGELSSAQPGSSAATNNPPDQPIPQTSSAQTDLRLGPGDLAEIKVYGAPELSDTLRVSSGGEIAMPLIGVVKVAGLTPEQAQKEIAQRLLVGGFLRDPHVNILIKEFGTQGISVLGEVAHPGIYPMLGSRRLFDVISAAGGMTNRAGKTIVITHRDQPSDASVITLAKDARQVARQNAELEPGDTVMVSKAGIVYVSGDVKLPGGYLMDNNESLTVLQAIALAQGINPTASIKNVRIIRRTSGRLQEIPVELREIMQAKSPDLELENEDVLFVPNSASKSAARRSLESIVQVATGLAIYRR